MTKASSLRDMALPELELSVTDLNKQIFGLINEKNRSKKVDQPHLLRMLKKQRARTLTVISEKKSATKE